MARGYDIYESSLLGPVAMIACEQGVEEIFLTEESFKEYLKQHPELRQDETVCLTVKTQIEEYFQGKRQVFEVPVCIEGTPFRKKVWQALCEIPYGTTQTYGQIASRIENPKACRAVGSANRANPIPLIIPCHRVTGSQGKLVGFMGNQTEIQALLIAHERKVLEKCESGSV